MSDYLLSGDFPVYSGLFKTQSARTVELMRILSEQIETDLPTAYISAKDLYSMVDEMSYKIDREYKKQKNIVDPEDSPIVTYLSRASMVDEMRNLFREEFKRYLDGQKNENK